MDKLHARYYYAPICTEAFASLNRLRDFFSKLKKDISFTAFNIASEDLIVDKTYQVNEANFIKGLKSNSRQLKYGKLFLNDIEIPGFPPSKRHIEEILSKEKIDADYTCLKSPYHSPQGKSGNYNPSQIKTDSLDKNNCKDICLLCTKYNRYLDEDHYIEKDWVHAEEQKSEHLKDVIDKKEVIGFIEYYQNRPMGFIEGYSTKLAQIYGFIINNLDKSCMITCLHIQEAAGGIGLASKLIKQFIEEAKKRDYHFLEVIAFDDNINWQPKSLFLKMGFKVVKEIEDAYIMSMTLV